MSFIFKEMETDKMYVCVPDFAKIACCAKVRGDVQLGIDGCG